MKKFLSWKPFRKLSLILQIAEEQKDRNVTGNTEINLTFLQLIRAIPTKNAGLSNLISELTQGDSKGKIKTNLVWQVWQWLFWKKLHLPLKRCFCKEIEPSNIKRKSGQHSQVITLSRLSHKRLPSSSFCLPVAQAHYYPIMALQRTLPECICFCVKTRTPANLFNQFFVGFQVNAWVTLKSVPLDWHLGSDSSWMTLLRITRMSLITSWTVVVQVESLVASHFS